MLDPRSRSAPAGVLLGAGAWAAWLVARRGGGEYSREGLVIDVGAVLGTVIVGVAFAGERLCWQRGLAAALGLASIVLAATAPEAR